MDHINIGFKKKGRPYIPIIMWTRILITNFQFKTYFSGCVSHQGEINVNQIGLVWENVYHLFIWLVWSYESVNQVSVLITHIVKGSNLWNLNLFPYLRNESKGEARITNWAHLHFFTVGSFGEFRGPPSTRQHIRPDGDPVSYTHLTLPTIYSV